LKKALPRIPVSPKYGCRQKQLRLFRIFREKIPQNLVKNAREIHAKRVKIFYKRGFRGAKPSIHWGFLAGTGSAKL
jgi:hypothetical protein